MPRERFVAARLGRRAYADSALPIRDQQTISQPWVVAAICQALELRGSERVLEVGTGSGYSTAILAQLAAARAQPRALRRARGRGARTVGRARPRGPRRVEIRVGDGTLGAPDEAPFEAIAVHASAPAPPPSLVDQLAPGGRLVLPLAEPGVDMLTALTMRDGELVARRIAPCRFVPLVGEQGFSDRGA